MKISTGFLLIRAKFKGKFLDIGSDVFVFCDIELCVKPIIHFCVQNLSLNLMTIVFMSIIPKFCPLISPTHSYVMKHITNDGHRPLCEGYSQLVLARRHRARHRDFFIYFLKLFELIENEIPLAFTSRLLRHTVLSVVGRDPLMTVNCDPLMTGNCDPPVTVNCDPLMTGICDRQWRQSRASSTDDGEP